MSEARHIQSMIDFIEREAQEKVEELEAAAQEEYDVEKMRVVETEKAKIRALNEKKMTQVEIDCRVSQANFSKTQRMRIMAERAKVMEELFEVTKKSILQTISNPSEYQKLLEDLIQESINYIATDAVVTCIQQDEPLVSSIVKNMKKVKVSISKEYLSKDEVWGGVVVSSVDGRIVCNNTLAHRAKTCFDEQLPTVRYYLFNPDVSLTP